MRCPSPGHHDEPMKVPFTQPGGITDIVEITFDDINAGLLDSANKVKIASIGEGDVLDLIVIQVELAFSAGSTLSLGMTSSGNYTDLSAGSTFALDVKTTMNAFPTTHFSEAIYVKAPVSSNLAQSNTSVYAKFNASTYTQGKVKIGLRIVSL